ncbi:MAG: CBS domain-containing protein [Nitrospirales bacterium]
MVDESQSVNWFFPASKFDHASQTIERLGMKSLPVVDHGQVVGMLTEHGIISECTAKGLDPPKTQVRQIMIRGDITCSENHSLKDVLRTLRQMNKRCPVVIDTHGQPVGMVAQEDLVRRSTESGPAHSLKEKGESVDGKVTGQG